MCGRGGASLSSFPLALRLNARRFQDEKLHFRRSYGFLMIPITRHMRYSCPASEAAQRRGKNFCRFADALENAPPSTERWRMLSVSGEAKRLRSSRGHQDKVALDKVDKQCARRKSGICDVSPS